jgi:hypothetical protein
MAGKGKKTFVAGEVLLAQDVNDYLMDQSVMNFATVGARSSAIPTPTTGMTTYIGTTGTASIPQIETYTGSAWQTPYGITLISTATVTAAATLTFSNVFSSTYDNYVLTHNGINNGGASGFFRLTFGATATGYYQNLFDGRSGAGSVVVQITNANTTSLSISPNWNLGSQFQCFISNPFATARTIVNTQFSAMDSSPISTVGQAGGALNDTTSYTSCTLVSSAGSMTGTFRLYGLRNS